MYFTSFNSWIRIQIASKILKKPLKNLNSFGISQVEKSHVTLSLKGLSSEMDGGIKVVSISLKNESLQRSISFFIKGPVHNLHLKISALCKVLHSK